MSVAVYVIVAIWGVALGILLGLLIIKRSIKKRIKKAEDWDNKRKDKKVIHTQLSEGVDPPKKAEVKEKKLYSSPLPPLEEPAVSADVAGSSLK